MTTNGDWEEVNVPRGSYVGWGDKAGQHVTGEIIEYQEDGGTDFDGRVCPQVSVVLTEPAHSHSKQNGWSEFPAGELVVINCGQSSLKRAVQAARLNTGDLMKLEHKGIENLKGGKTCKIFGVKVKRGSGELSSNAQSAMAKAAAADAPASNGAPAGDPWGAPAAAGSFGGGNDEPPF